MFKKYKAAREIAFTKAMKSKKKPSITRALIGFPRFTEAQTGMYLHGKNLKGSKLKKFKTDMLGLENKKYINKHL
jgi:hypothetical protein